jgi:hypothetical protein
MLDIYVAIYIALLGAVFAFALVQISHGIYLLSNSLIKSTANKREYCKWGLHQIAIAIISVSFSALATTGYVLEYTTIINNSYGIALLHSHCSMGYLFIQLCSLLLLFEDVFIKQKMNKLNLT